MRAPRPFIQRDTSVRNGLCEIGVIADAAMATGHLVHLDAHLLDALHQRGRLGIGRRKSSLPDSKCR